MPGLKRKLVEPAAIGSSKIVKKQKLQTPSTKSLSAEFVVDSSSDEGAERQDSTVNKPSFPFNAPEKSVPNVKESQSTSTADSSNPQSNPSTSQYDGPAVMSHASSTESSESTSSSEESEFSSKAVHQRAGLESTTGSKSSGGEEEDGDEEELIGVEEMSRSALIEPPRPYEPPPGFEAATITSPSPSSQPHNIFAKANLEGKQIWHITAPASVPITSIKDVPVKTIEAGASIVSYKGNEYSFSTEPEINSTTEILLLPNTEHNDYRSVAAGISKTLYLQQVVKLPLSTPTSNRAATGGAPISKSHVKETRLQPQGLKRRYRPFGNTSSSDESVSTTQIQMPPIRSSAQAAKARDQQRLNHVTPLGSMSHDPRPDPKFHFEDRVGPNERSSQAHEPQIDHALLRISERRAKHKEDKKKGKFSKAEDDLSTSPQSEHRQDRKQDKEERGILSESKKTSNKTSDGNTVHKDNTRLKDPSDQKVQPKTEKKRRKKLEEDDINEIVNISDDSLTTPIKAKSKRRKRKFEATEP
ncbi:MAG: hypothetical protein Q9220_006355 [cf. Caloplaca sp. 1 TL-2023]